MGRIGGQQRSGGSYGEGEHLFKSACHLLSRARGSGCQLARDSKVGEMVG